MRPISGENSFVVRWRRIAGKYRLYLPGRRGIRIEHVSFAEAEDLLVDELHDRFGQLGIQLIYDPPKPVKESESWRESGWVLLVPDTFLGAAIQVDYLFTDGRCKFCRLGRGERSNLPVRIGMVPKGIQVGYVAGGYPVPVVSEQFLGLFSDVDLKHLRIKRCRVADGKGNRQYFELLAPKLVRCVDVSIQPDMVSWKCDVCGRIEVEQYLKNGFPFTVKQGSLPADAQVALVGFDFHYNLAITRALWKKISRTREAKGLSPEPLGMVDQSRVGSSYRVMLSKHWKVPAPK